VQWALVCILPCTSDPNGKINTLLDGCHVFNEVCAQQESLIRHLGRFSPRSWEVGLEDRDRALFDNKKKY
jgi:hypothetical protein